MKYNYTVSQKNMLHPLVTIISSNLNRFFQNSLTAEKPVTFPIFSKRNRNIGKGQYFSMSRVKVTFGLRVHAK